MNSSTIDSVDLLLKDLTEKNAFWSLEQLCVICKPENDAKWVLERADEIKQAQKHVLEQFAEHPADNQKELASEMEKVKWSVYGLLQDIKIRESWTVDGPLAEMRRKAEPIYQQGRESILDTLAGFVADEAMLDLEDLSKEERLEREYELHTRLADYREVLFCYFATCEIWDKEDFDEFSKILYSSTIRGFTLSIIVSALMLANLNAFDLYKWVLVLGVYDCSPSPLAKERALLAVVITAMYVPDIYMEKIQEITDKMMARNKKFLLDLLLLSKLLVRSKNYEEDGHEVMHTLFQGIIKMTSDVVKEKLNEIGNEDDEIEELLHQDDDEEGEGDEELSSYAKKLYDLMENGADIYYNQFKHFVKNDFFQKSVVNWFMPIYIEHPALMPIRKKLHNEAPLHTLIDGATMCDVDIYGFLLSLPEDEKKLNDMLSQMMPPDPKDFEDYSNMLGDEDGEDDEEQEAEDEAENEIQEAENEETMEEDASVQDDEMSPKEAFLALTSSVQELYRFFNLSPASEAFTNPMDVIFFGNPVAPIVSEAFESEKFDKVRLPLARYCLEREEYDAILQLLENQQTDTEECHYMLAKAYAFCEEPNLKEAKEHVNWLLKSSPDNMKFNQLCHDVSIENKDYGLALKCLDKLMAVEQNEDMRDRLLGLKACCYTYLHDFGAAVKCNYELYYKHPENDRYTVALAHSLLDRDAGDSETLDKVHQMLELAFKRKLDTVNLPKVEELDELDKTEAFQRLMEGMQSMLTMDHTWDSHLHAIAAFCTWAKDGFDAAKSVLLDMLKAMNRKDENEYEIRNGINLAEFIEPRWFESYGISEEEVELASNYIYAKYMEFVEKEELRKKEEKKKMMLHFRNFEGGMDAEQ